MKNFIAGIVIFAFVANPAHTADYTALPKEGAAGECRKGEKVIPGAELCGVCREKDGDRIVQEYEVFCKENDSSESVKTKKILTASVSCEEPGFTAQEQSEKLNTTAKEYLNNNLIPLYSLSDCDLDDWPPRWLRKGTLKVVGTGVVVVAGIAAVKLAENPWDCYDVRPKEGKKGQCYNKKGTKRMSGAQYCHNCRESTGELVIWNYEIRRNNNPTGKFVKGKLQCNKYYPDESEQLKLIEENARKEMKAIINNGELEECG
ncbi:MAG: hypothetical protein ACR2P5_08835 [Gammaproteobacteria bacterium]